MGPLEFSLGDGILNCRLAVIDQKENTVMKILDRLGKHPFAIKAHFKESLVLTYSMPLENLRHLIPDCLEIDSYQERYGFIAVALVQTENLRPHFMPSFMGNNFTLLGYRTFVRYRGCDGRRRRGLYILRSETDRSRMVWLGNLFTRYQYRKVGISWQDQIITSSDGLMIRRDRDAKDIALPESSIFPDWRSARQFAGPMPYTFSFDQTASQMTTVEGVRQTWKPQPVKILEDRIPFLKELGLGDARLANAFTVKDIPYRWKRGITEPCP